MEEIRIYHSLRKNAILMVASVIMVVYVLMEDSDGSNPFRPWFDLFAFACLFVSLYMLLGERVFRRPFIVVTDELVRVNYIGHRLELNLEDVAGIGLVGSDKIPMIGVDLEEEAEQRMRESEGFFKKYSRKFNERLYGYWLVLPANDLTVKPEQLLDLIGERLTDCTKG